MSGSRIRKKAHGVTASNPVQERYGYGSRRWGSVGVRASGPSGGPPHRSGSGARGRARRVSQNPLKDMPVLYCSPKTRPRYELMYEPLSTPGPAEGRSKRPSKRTVDPHRTSALMRDRRPLGLGWQHTLGRSILGLPSSILGSRMAAHTGEEHRSHLACCSKTHDARYSGR